MVKPKFKVWNYFTEEKCWYCAKTYSTNAARMGPFAEMSGSPIEGVHRLGTLGGGIVALSAWSRLGQLRVWWRAGRLVIKQSGAGTQCGGLTMYICCAVWLALWLWTRAWPSKHAKDWRLGQMVWPFGGTYACGLMLLCVMNLIMFTIFVELGRQANLAYDYWLMFHHYVIVTLVYSL